MNNIEEGANKTIVTDNLSSSSSTEALSAKQGKNLDDKIGNFSNPNLLNNPYFIVNQRNRIEVTSNDFIVDCWKSKNGKATVVDNGINIFGESETRGLKTWFIQSIDNFDKLLGKTLTLSIDLAENNCDEYIQVCFWNSSYDFGADGVYQIFGSIEAGKTGIISFTDVIPDTFDTSKFCNLVLRTWSTHSDFTIRSAKLEFGMLSTLKNDIPLSYEEELLKCILSKGDPNDTFSNKKISDICGSNENLLDNPFFTINQRGLNEYLDFRDKYTIDRWRTYSTLSVIVNTDGTLTLKNNSTTDAFLMQVIETIPSDRIMDRIMTFSVDVRESQGDYAIHGYDGSNINGLLMNDIGIKTFTFKTTKSYLRVGVRIKPGTSIKIKSMKLEFGCISTLSLDTAPNYENELLKCQRFYQRIRSSTNFNTGLCMGYSTRTVTLSTCITPMRIKPSLNTDYTKWYICEGNHNVVNDSINNMGTNYYPDNSCIEIYVDTSTSNIAIGKIYQIRGKNTGAYIELSADL